MTARSRSAAATAADAVEPTEVEGVTEIHIKVAKQPLVYQLDVLFVWVDPNGFAGANRNRSCVLDSCSYYLSRVNDSCFN